MQESQEKNFTKKIRYSNFLFSTKKLIDKEPLYSDYIRADFPVEKILKSVKWTIQYKDNINYCLLEIQHWTPIKVDINKFCSDYDAKCDARSFKKGDTVENLTK